MQVMPSRRVIRHWSTGETWNWFDLGATTQQRYGTPHVMLHRGDLHGALADAVRAQKARCDRARPAAASAIRSDERPCRGPVRGRLDRTRRLPHRRRRHPLQGAREPVRRRPSGVHRRVAWRGLVPMAKLPPHLAADAGANWLGPHGFVLHYPVRRGELMNFISFVERDDWQIESWVDRRARPASSPTTSPAGTRTCTPSSATSRRPTNGR